MIDELIVDMFDNGMIQFGDFTLKSGIRSNIYIDARNAISYPHIFKLICDLLSLKIINLKHDSICGVPYSAITIASVIAYTNEIPMLLKRKEVKKYGTKKILEGNYSMNDCCIIIEDVVTTGASIYETIKTLKEHEVIVNDVVCLIERNQGGREHLVKNGCNLHSLIDLKTLVSALLRHKKISKEQGFLVLQNQLISNAT